MNKMHQSLAQRQTQNLLLKPKMLQSLEMLTLPMMELEAYLKQELETNPLMELLEERDEDENSDLEETATAEEERESEDNEIVDDELKRTLEESKELSEILDTWNEQFDDVNDYQAPQEDNQYEKANEYESEIIKQSFYEQLDELELPDNEYDFAYDLIDSANAYGFLPPEFNVAEFAVEYGISSERAEEIRQMILHFYPAGITALSQQECLISQLDKKNREHQILIKLIEEDFDDVIHKRHKKIAAKYNVTQNTVLHWRELISHLDPKPGLRVLKNEDKFIVPDVIIKKIDSEYEVIVNDYSFPKIRMSKNYKAILKNVKSKQEVDYVRDKINSAKFIIKSIYLRNRTLKRVVNAIIKHQYDFFYEDRRYLRPLVYSEIADELQVSDSTICRVVRTKYADTPFGIMCLKDFFTSKAGKDVNYDAVSRHSVEHRVMQYIENEDKDNPLSDQEIADRLLQEGVNVSRRLVSKYRQALGILNSHLRRV
jgi:RNA polymerase sigma-54 factor